MLVEAEIVPEGSVYPAIIDVGFQAAFAMITCAIITGSVAGVLSLVRLLPLLRFGLF